MLAENEGFAKQKFPLYFTEETITVVCLVVIQMGVIGSWLFRCYCCGVVILVCDTWEFFDVAICVIHIPAMRRVTIGYGLVVGLKIHARSWLERFWDGLREHWLWSWGGLSEWHGYRLNWCRPYRLNVSINNCWCIIVLDVTLTFAIEPHNKLLPFVYLIENNMRQGGNVLPQ
jgi:hypothetical protein